MAKKEEKVTASTTEIEKLTATKALSKFDYGEDAGAGYEGQSSEDVTIPFMKLLQDLSPELKRDDLGEQRIRSGMWFNTVTNKLYSSDKGFLFVPSMTKHCYARFTPRAQGGGFHGHEEIESPVVLEAKKKSTEFGEYLTPEGHELRETFYVYGVICSEDGHAEGMALIAFNSTKIRAYKQWNTRIKYADIRGAKPPLFAHLVRITSTEMKNTQGTFFVPKLMPADPRGIEESLLDPTDERFLMAKACYALVNSGEADKRVKFADQDSASESGGSKKDVF